MLTASSVLANEEFKQELNQAAQVLDDTSKQTTDSMNVFDKKLKELRKTQADNVKQQKKLNEELENSKLPAFFKEIIALKANIEGINTNIRLSETAIQENVRLKSESGDSAGRQLYLQNIREKIEGKKNEIAFKKMNDSLFKISEAELTRRKEFDENIKIKKEELELAKKTSPEASTEADKGLKNLKVKEEKEQVRRDKQQTSVFAKGFQGLQNKFDDFGKSLKGKGITALKTGLFVAAYYALSQFLQSDAFKKTVAFIYNVIIPNLKEIGIVIGVLAGLLVVSKIASIISGMITSFKIIKGAFLATKIGLALASAPLLPIIGIIAGIALIIGGLFVAFDDFKKTLEETGSIGEALKVGISKFAAVLVGFPLMLMTKAMAFIADMFGFEEMSEELSNMDPIQFIADFFVKVMDFVAKYFTKLGAGIIAFIANLNPFSGKSPMKAFSEAFDDPSSMGANTFTDPKTGKQFIKNEDGTKTILQKPFSILRDEDGGPRPGSSIVNNNIVTTNNSSEEHMGVAIKNGRDESNEYRMVN